MKGALGSVGYTLGIATLPRQDLAVTLTRDSLGAIGLGSV